MRFFLHLALVTVTLWQRPESFTFHKVPLVFEQPLVFLKHLLDSQDKAPKKQFILSLQAFVYVSTAPGMKGRNIQIMRSHLIFGALAPVQNRYMLCQLVSKATRKFHRPATRVQDTMNDVLHRFAASNEPARVMATATPVAAAERKAA